MIQSKLFFNNLSTLQRIKETFGLITLSNSFGKLEITTYGAHVLSYVPSNSEEVLWLSPYTKIEKNEPIRGGIPICCPWFGPKRDKSDWPLHGVLRNRDWKVEKQSDDVLVLGTSIEENDNPYGCKKLKALYTVELGKTLALKLSLTNMETEAVTMEAGLHTYFLANPQACTFSDFSGLRYYDKCDDYKQKTEEGDFCFDSERETANFYMDAHRTNAVYDHEKKRKLVVHQKGFDSTILWSPGRGNGSMNQEIKEQWDRFLCLESAGCMDNRITIQPGQSYEAQIQIQTEAIYE